MKKVAGQWHSKLKTDFDYYCNDIQRLQRLYLSSNLIKIVAITVVSCSQKPRYHPRCSRDRVLLSIRTTTTVTYGVSMYAPRSVRGYAP
jgi:hypothetical protein